MGDVIEILTTATNAVEVIAQGPQGPKGDKGDPGDVAGLPLSTQGDLLYRGASENQRLPIGTTGQVLKVAGGIPSWANESGAVTSVNGATGAVTVAAATHAVEHEFDGADPLQAKAALVTTDIGALNGVYFWDGTTTSGRPNFFRTGTRKNTKIVYNSGTGQWNLVRNLTIEAVGVDGPSTVPWDNTWEEFVTPTTVTVTQLPLETMVQKLAETGGTATATTSEDGLMSSSDKTKLNAISAGAEVNVQANWTEADTGSDAFILNKPSTFAPSAHSSSHASAGSDPLAPSDIGAQSIFATEALGTVTADVTLTAARAKIYTLNTTTSGLRILLPTNNVQTGDVVQIRFASQNGSTIAPVRGTLTGFFGNSIRSGQQVTFIAESTSGTSWEEAATNRTPPETITLTAGDVVVGKATSGAGTATQVSIGTEENSVARGNHVHGNITNDGKVGSTAGLPVVTTTAGAVTTLALGTAGQVLRTKSDLSGVEFADPAASGVTGTAASASDVLGVSGANITGVDANADRIVYWNNTSNKLAYGTPADAGAAAASHTHAASDITSGLAASATTDTTNASNISSGTLATARMGSGTPSASNYLRGDGSWQTVAAGGVTSGSVDNAILRADGTGGSTSQSSEINIEDASTTTQNNVTISNQHSGQTNSALVLTPKGTGAFILGPKPDGTTTGGNARGARAVDLQWETRFAATMVASGQASAILNGLNNTASGSYAVAWGQSCTASGTRSTAGGFSATASGAYSGLAIGWNVTASGSYGATALGAGTTSDRQGMFAFASGRPWSSNAGVAQNITHVLHGRTTTNAAVELLAGDWNEGTVRLTVPSGRVLTGLLTIVGTKSDGATVASYMRQVTIKNVGGTTSLVGSVNTVGVDEAGGTSIAITANDTNDALKIEATGVSAQTFRWVCTANMTEMTYGA